MSTGYDPRRSRPRPATAPDPEAAPIDALLGPEPEGDEAPDAEAEAPTASPGTADREVVTPLRPVRPAPRSGAPSRLVQLAPLAILGGLIALVVWWRSRDRRGRG